MTNSDIIDRALSGTASGTLPGRVAVFWSTGDISGPGRQLAGLARGLARHGVELRVVLLVRGSRGLAGFDQYLSDQGVAYDIIPDGGALDPAVIRAVARYLDHWRPDIVQSHGYKSAGIIYALRCLGRRPPWIGFSHGETDLGLRDRLYNRVHDLMLPTADRIVVMSERQLRPFATRPGKARVIHNAVLQMTTWDGEEPNLTRLIAFRAASPRPLIGIVGRMSHEKGHDILLDSLARLGAQGVGFSLAIVGEGPLRADLERQASMLGLADRVLFAGRIEAMHRVYEQLDLLVIASRSEGLPNVLLEGIAADVPVVCTRVGAVPELLALVPDAFVMVPAGEPAALADGIGTALGQLGSAERRRGRAEISRLFTVEARIERHLQLYAEVLAARSRA